MKLVKILKFGTLCIGWCGNIALNNIKTKKALLMEKLDERFEKIRFQVKGKYILKSLDSKSKKTEKILFEKKKVNLSMVTES